jgi:hypothetical protein
MSKVVVTWPECQKLFKLKGFRENCSLINGDIGLKVYGSAAFLVDEEWYNSEEYEDEEFEEDNLEICYDDELYSLGLLSDEDFE